MIIRVWQYSTSNDNFTVNRLQYSLIDKYSSVMVRLAMLSLFFESQIVAVSSGFMYSGSLVWLVSIWFILSVFWIFIFELQILYRGCLIHSGLYVIVIVQIIV